MNYRQILDSLYAELAAIDFAIQAMEQLRVVQRGVKKRGRPPKRLVEVREALQDERSH